MGSDFKAKGDIYVFVDECHRTQSGRLHDAMKMILPDAMFIGFTGTPLLKKDRQKSIEIFGEMHRYIPVIAHREGFKKIGEKVVEHRARKYGTTKFGLERFINGPLDLMTIMFISRFGKRPMHIFGTIGASMFMIGLALTGYLITLKFMHLYVWHTKSPLVSDQVPFYLALTAMIIGTQLLLAGFVGELITRNSATRNQYKVREKL
jgi:hypothetical protein